MAHYYTTLRGTNEKIRLSKWIDGRVNGRENRRVINKALYPVLAVNLNEQKELSGMWLGQTVGAKFWLSVLTELQNRGLKDIFIVCVDGIIGLFEAIETVLPQTRVQLCLVHLMRNSLRYVSYKHMKAVATDLKAISRPALRIFIR
jgi:putative transposase